MNEGEEFDLSSAPVHAHSPHSSWSTLVIGDVSVLFSYERPVGISLADRTYTRSGMKRATQKRLNSWRSFRQMQMLPEDDFDSLLLTLLNVELKDLIGKLSSKAT